MMKSQKVSRCAIPFLTLALTLFITVALGTTQALAAWKPSRPIEFIIMAGKGGGADRIARLMQKIVTQNKWSPQPLVPINKKGGSGAEAMLYLLSKKGNPHVILVTLNSFFTTPALRKLPVNYTKLTPVYRLAMDTFLLWVNPKSGIKNMDDFVKAVKAKKGKWTMGGTGKMQEDQLVTNMLMQAYGIEGMITYVPFRGGGTVAKNLAGGHVDSTVNNPSEGLPHYPGKMRPIAALTPARIPAFKEVPTFKEMGQPQLVYFMQRSITAPGGIPKDALKWYSDLFSKLCASGEWKTYTEKKALNRACLTGAPLGEFFASEDAKHKKLLMGMGLLKN
jgi:tripartite-type tricarboxylate transporter receptor subunit TctC